MVRNVREFVSRLGPTWLAGAIAAGPATMGSLLAAGAGFGYSLLWVVVLSALLGALAQYLATKLALGTEQGIVATVEEQLGELWAWLLVADVFLAAGLAQLVIMKTLADVSSLLTGVDARLWGIAWAVVLAVGLAGGGYRFAEIGAKIVVSAVVLTFIASLFVVPIDVAGAAGGLVPQLPGGVGAAVVVAGVLGGAVHVTIVTMQTYTVRARGWTDADSDVARFDIYSSMVVAFGLYSVAIFFVAAGVLAGTEGPLDAVSAAESLGPIAGPHAQALFFAGLLGAAVSTLGGNTIVPPYLLADKLGWETDVSDARYRALVAGVALVSAGGAFIEGAFFPLLVLVLAFGLVGTPFAIAIVVVLLNSSGVEASPSTALNVGGVVLFAVASVIAGEFVRDEFVAVREAGILGAGMSSAAVVFAAVLGFATVTLLALHATGRFDGRGRE